MKKPIKAVIPVKPDSPIMWHSMKTSFGRPADNIVYHPMKTSFGSHSIMWHTLQTVFGSHSLIGKKVDESKGVKSFSQFNELLDNMSAMNKMKDLKKFTPHYEDHTGKDPYNRGQNTEFNLKEYNEKVHVPRGKIDEGIRRYTLGSVDLNTVLHQIRVGEVKPEENYNYKERKNHIEELDAAFADKRNHVGIDHEVFTGLVKSPHIILNKDRANNPNHDPAHVHTHLPAFTSTSTNIKTAKDFAKPDPHDPHGAYGHILHIRVPKDHPSISTKESSFYDHEDEVLLHRGTRLKIHSEPEH